ncbi:MAG: DUF2520 domain-containing protein [Bacteroidetes bacterium]|nr:DUF2520 domain-containing protein [Bacteroidota bacterium]
MQTISFIGSGNLAWHLAPAFDNAGFIVKEVFSPNTRHAEELTERLYQAEVKATLDFSTSDSSIFIIAANDDSISDIAKEIILPDDAVLTHTSGSVPLTDLQFAATSNIGVFYPLQTFSKSKKIDFKQTPIFIESNNEQTESVLMTLAKAISNQVKQIGSEERKALHIAAVFASNFTNHMLTLSQKIMLQNGMEFDWLKPLIIETINKSLQVGPESAQTGPARRGDLETLEKHMAFLQSDPDLSEVYKIISQHIINLYHED